MCRLNQHTHAFPCRLFSLTFTRGLSRMPAAKTQIANREGLVPSIAAWFHYLRSTPFEVIDKHLHTAGPLPQHFVQNLHTPPPASLCSRSTILTWPWASPSLCCFYFLCHPSSMLTEPLPPFQQQCLPPRPGTLCALCHPPAPANPNTHTLNNARHQASKAYPLR